MQRTRFAPSPTGYLHFGGLRTALFNYLYARQQHASFLLRIEDTDTKRTIPDASRKLYDTLLWAKIFPDIGFNVSRPQEPDLLGPFVQSQRIHIYSNWINTLLNTNHAYRCFCSPERLSKLRSDQIQSKLPPGYDGKCRHLSQSSISQLLKTPNTPFTIRFKIPHSGVTKFHDLIHGDLQFSNKVLDDMIIMKSDGVPTYHLANVIDDHLMNITTVMRGQEWISSTPKHILLYNAFGWKPPIWAHLPLLVNKDGSKLSKRQNDITISSLRDQGYLSEAIIDFVSSLGRNSKHNNEISSMEELIKNFDIKQINKSPSIVSMENLDYLNKLHIIKALDSCTKQYIINFVRKDLYSKFKNNEIISKNNLDNDEFLEKLLHASKLRVRRLNEFSNFIQCVFVRPNFNDQDNFRKLNDDTLKLIRFLIEKFKETRVSDWNSESITECVHRVSEAHNCKHAEIIKPCRYFITGAQVGIEFGKILEFVGKVETIERLESAAKMNLL